MRQDALICPVFAARIRDWELHLERMCAFCICDADDRRYQGQPTQKDLPLPVDARHFDRWLDLFEATARELYPPKAADHFVDRARRIAKSLELGIAGVRGITTSKGVAPSK